MHHVAIPVTIVPKPQEEKLPTTRPSDIHRVLLAVDGSKHAARAVEYVCNLRGPRDLLQVELLNVPQASPIPPGYVWSFDQQEKLDSWHRKASEGVLQAATDALHAAGVHLNAHILAGPPAGNIVELAQKHDCTRIVMGTRGLGPIIGPVLGSVAYTVLHLSPIPVTLVK